MNHCVTGSSKYIRKMLMTHRAYLLFAALTGTLLLLSDPAAAQDGSYSVTFDEVTSNCDSTHGLALKKGTLQLTSRERGIQLQMTGLPAMRGTQRAGGKIKAEAEATDGKGIRRRFRVSGRTRDKGIQLLVIAELYRGETSLCTQSWNVTGQRR